MDAESLVKGRLNGRTSKYPLSAQTVPLSVALASKTDPSSMWPGAPPNFGQPDMPHIFSFVGRYGMVANAYMHADEALMHSSANAEIMRNEPMIMECVEARMRCVALLNWHIQPVDNDVLQDALDKADSQDTAMRIRSALKKPKSDAKVMADKLTSILKHTPHFMKMRYSLMDAIWYGKAATVQTMGVRSIGGQRRVYIRKWEPRHGDKMIFRYADDSYEYDADQLGIRIGPSTGGKNDNWVDYAGFERNRIDPTQHGLVYWFDGQQRKRMCLHKHIIEDGDFMRPEKAGSINGVGIRSRIYWTWWAYQESLKLLLEYVERSALGIEIWKYPAHDPKAKERTEKAAQERGAPGRSVMLVPIPTGEYGDMYGVQIVEPGLGGISELQSVLQTFFGHKLKRYILGQTLTSEAEATGMGSGVADAHLATFHDIIRFDGLNLEETLTTDLLRPLQQWNFPGTDDVYLRFVIDTESPDAQERIGSYQAAWAMGVKIRSEDIYDALGASPPVDGEEFLDNPGLESARINNEAQKQQLAQQAMMMQAQMGGGQPQQFVPFPDMGQSSGVPGDADGDGLASDDNDQLFEDQQRFQSSAAVERFGSGMPDDFADVPLSVKPPVAAKSKPAAVSQASPQPALQPQAVAPAQPDLPKAINGNQLRAAAKAKQQATTATAKAPQPIARPSNRQEPTPIAGDSPASMATPTPAVKVKQKKLTEREQKEADWQSPHREAINPYFKKWNKKKVDAIARPIAPEASDYRHTVDIHSGDEPFQAINSDKPGTAPLAVHVARALDDRSLQRGGKLDINNPEHRERISQDMASEVAKYAQTAGATGWYDKSIEHMMQWLNRLYPNRFSNDPHAAALFKLCVAVHSSATEVTNNLEEAVKQFDHYAEHGRFNTSPNGKGKTLKTQAKHRDLINKMMDKFQWQTPEGRDKMVRFLSSEIKNKELAKEMGKGVSGLKVGDKVLGAQYFGPKIGAFYNNLHGNYDPVTVDMWFMRSLGRLRGTLTEHSVNAIREQAVRTHNELLRMRGNDPQLHGMDRRQLIQQCKHVYRSGNLEGTEQLAQWADLRHKAYKKKDRATGKSYSDRSEINYAAKSLDESFKAQNLAPDSSEWEHLLRSGDEQNPGIVERAQKILRDQGLHMSNAEFQAALWYYEKELWEKLGYDLSTDKDDDEDDDELEVPLTNRKKRATERIDFGKAAEELYHRLREQGRQVI